MSVPLRILFIGVAQQAVELLLSELRRGDFAPEATVLADAQRLAEVLCGEFQIVIADSQDQHTELICDVSALLRERLLDIALLAYSRPGSHDFIVEVMHAGAQDFISANNPARILPVVQRELANARLRAEQREQVVTDYLLQEIDGLILQAWDVVPLVTQICRRVVELFDFELCWIGGKQADGSVSVMAAAGAVEYLQSLEVRWDDTPQGRGTTGMSISQLRPVVLKVDSDEFAPWRERAQRFGMKSILSLPMMACGAVTGALMFYSARRELFDAATIKRFSVFADRVAVALLVTQEQQQLRLLSAAMNSAINAMFITGRDGNMVWFNEALMQFSGYAGDEIINRNPRMFSSGEHDTAFWNEMWQTLLQGRAWHGDVVNRRRDGSLFCVVQNITPLYNDQGALTHFLAVQQDVSEKKELEREIKYLAYHDVLTGLPNRMLFQDRMQLAITQAKRDKTELALLFVDLDGFKSVNDSYGHAAGDRLLQMVAERLRACVREGDTVARLSGDEFTVLLRDISDDEGVQRIAAKIAESIACPYEMGEYHATVTASIGISLYPQHATGVEKLMIYADEAMYRAKQAGKNSFQFYRL
jgi:diguanylate cyclase (GGDEF)-like protein/PAS domain S-box-containing protein